MNELCIAYAVSLTYLGTMLGVDMRWGRFNRTLFIGITAIGLAALGLRLTVSVMTHDVVGAFVIMTMVSIFTLGFFTHLNNYRPQNPTIHLIVFAVFAAGFTGLSRIIQALNLPLVL